jgi:hypothetical protein
VKVRLSSSACCEIGGVHWWLAPGGSVAEAEPLLGEALRRLDAGARNLKNGRRKQLYRLALPPPLGECLLKVNRYDRDLGRLRRARRSKARRELATAAGLRVRGIDTPLPYAAGERRAAGGLHSCYLLIPVIPGARDLKALWRAADSTRAERRVWAADLGALARRLHDAGVEQRDFAPNNFLVRPGLQATLLPIDFERTRLRRRLGRRARLRMLAKLDRHMAGSGSGARMRFLQAYANGDPVEARRWWQHATGQAAKLAAHDLARWKRTAPRAGRNVASVDWGGFTGWARRDAPEGPEAEARTAGRGAVRPPSSLGLQLQPVEALWCGSGAGGRREARKLWATAHLLSARGLAPRPVACVWRGDELRLWLARDSTSATLLQCCELPEAERAATVLIDRLLALGRVDPWLSTRKIALVRCEDGGLRALLLDPSALRVGRPRRFRRHERSRQLLEQRLQEVQQLRGAVR